MTKLQGEALENLGYLHDAVVEAVQFSFSTSDNARSSVRSIRIRVRANSDCGLEEINGRIVEVTLGDVVVAALTLLGHTFHSDTVSTFEEGVSNGTARRLEEMSGHGIRVPPIRLKLAFNSGSELEVACGTVELEVCTPARRD
ncbi:MAG: hypothetical protein M4D80_08605 [Myxococcota bacterium]|nr:hypothetical protein [Myxococcota bacterium]